MKKRMKPDLWMPLDIGDTLKKLQGVDASVAGAWLFLQLNHWGKPGVPGDDKELMMLCHVWPTDWGKVKQKLECLFRQDNGAWVDDGLIEEYKVANQSYQGKVEGGKIRAKQIEQERIAARTPTSSPPSLAEDSSKETMQGSTPKGDVHVGVQSFMSLYSVLSAWYRRKEGDQISYPEEHTLSEVSRRPNVLAEVEELRAFRDKADSFFPQSLLRLLETWGEVLDRARNYKPSGKPVPYERPVLPSYVPSIGELTDHITFKLPQDEMGKGPGIAWHFWNFWQARGWKRNDKPIQWEDEADKMLQRRKAKRE